MLSMLRGAAAAMLFAWACAASAQDLPAEIVRQLPPGYVVLGSASSSVAGHAFYFVALGSKHELNSYVDTPDKAPARPLLIFEGRPDGGYRLAGRNDGVILRVDDDGGIGCDPFEDHNIATKGPYFTVENGVSCASPHWTDYVTFRFDAAVDGFVFDNWRFQSWNLILDRNEDRPPDTQRLARPPKGRRVPFAEWRRPAA